MFRKLDAEADAAGISLNQLMRRLLEQPLPKSAREALVDPEAHPINEGPINPKPVATPRVPIALKEALESEVKQLISSGHHWESKRRRSPSQRSAVPSSVSPLIWAPKIDRTFLTSGI